MATREAIWQEISAIQVAIASFLVCTALVAFSVASDAADGQPAITPAVKCEALVGLSFAGPTIVIEKAEAVPEAPAGTVQVRPPDPETVRVAIPSNCRAQGVIDRRIGADDKNYAIGFAIALPDRWNGRFLFQGGGGLNGSTRPPLGVQATGDIPALARGFAVVSTDSGHQGAVFDASFMADQEAALNFAHASVGKVTAAAKAIIARYYGQPPARSYFVECSTGGREGMLASQRYLAEYDGIKIRLEIPIFRPSFRKIAPKPSTKYQ
jgi:feruloyl esterase